MDSLRDFVRALDEAGELVRVRESVSTVKEITEVADRCVCLAMGVSSLDEIGGRDGRSDRRRGAPVSGAERGGPSSPGQGRGMPRPGPGGPPKPQPKPLRAPVPPRPQPHPVRRPAPNRRGR